MKRKLKYMLAFMFLSGILINSCIKKPVYPSTPLIAYGNFFRYGSNPQHDPDSVVVSVTFQDEEGDVGLGPADTNGIFKYGNLWLVYFYDSSDASGLPHWAAVDTSLTNPRFDTLKIAYRVPVVLAQNETSQPMKGTIYVKMNRGAFRVPGQNRIRYQVYLYDKAMHKSNIITTPDFNF